MKSKVSERVGETASRLIVLRFAAIRLSEILWSGPCGSAQYPDSSKSEGFP